MQFARVIEEAQAAGAFTTEVLETMAESMDLETPELHELLARAQRAWDDAKRTVHHKRFDLVFLREGEGFSSTPDALVTLTLWSDRHETGEQAFGAFQDAVTQWARTTDEGREAWEYSAEDFNIGDLLTSYGVSGIPLAEHGITDTFVGWSFSQENLVIPYDRVLVHRQEMEEEE